MADAEIKAQLTQSAKDAAAKKARAYWMRVAIAIVGVAIVAVIINMGAHGSFLEPSNIVRVLRQITYNCILGVGQTFVIITAGIDLSVGSLVSLTGVTMALFANTLHIGGFPLIALTLLVGCIVGGLAGFVNAVPVVKLNLPPFITTLAMMLMARGLAFKISHGRPIPLNSPDFTNTGIGYFLHLHSILGLPGIPIPIVWMIVIVIACSILLMRTRFGRYVFAIGGNEEAARLAGVNVARTKTLVYVISGVAAAIVGFLYMALFSSGSPQTGNGFELQAIAAVVVGGSSLMGGRGSIVGTFFGAFLIGILYNVMNLLNIESYTQDVVLGAVIVLAVVLDELRKRYLTR
ncbi:MAG TPA: ABC transporter permease [Candidatus Baltobacteraceae bacterium]|jgi:ribose/xylose/arabinose/galactoside ABC-type transport system permease subunit